MHQVLQEARHYRWGEYNDTFLCIWAVFVLKKVSRVFTNGLVPLISSCSLFTDLLSGVLYLSYLINKFLLNQNHPLREHLSAELHSPRPRNDKHKLTWLSIICRSHLKLAPYIPGAEDVPPFPCHGVNYHSRSLSTTISHPNIPQSLVCSITSL